MLRTLSLFQCSSCGETHTDFEAFAPQGGVALSLEDGTELIFEGVAVCPTKHSLMYVMQMEKEKQDEMAKQ